MKYSYKRDKRITREYDPPLSARNPNPTEADQQRQKKIEEKYRRMKEKRNSTASIMPDYPDIVPTHPELSLEELRKQIEIEIKNAQNMTEWPDV